MKAKHNLILLAMVAFVTLAYSIQADYPKNSSENISGSVLGYDVSNKCWRPIAVDANGRVLVVIASDTTDVASDTTDVASDSEDVGTGTDTDTDTGTGTDTNVGG